MEIRAKKKKDESISQREKVKTPIDEVSKLNNASEKYSTFSHVFQVRLNSLLYNTIQNMIESSHAAGDYTYTSVVDVIRSALQAHKDGMQITEQIQPGEKIQTTIRVHKDLYEYNQQLPRRLKSTIHEKAIRTFLKNL